MKQAKPFKRIIRPFSLPSSYAFGYQPDDTYFAHRLYANDRYETIRAYHILEKDVIHLFEFVEPSDSNLATYSYRIYELLLRASTEFEQNCTKILASNGYPKTSNWNIVDYHKINIATKLNEYKLYINIWASGKKEFKPLFDWGEGHKLQWYTDYNSVKHNRHDEFHKATLENLLNALGAVYSVVFAQFNYFVLTALQPTMSYQSSYGNELSSSTSLFSVILPDTWQEEEMYNFDWRQLKDDTTPLQNYNFI